MFLLVIIVVLLPQCSNVFRCRRPVVMLLLGFVHCGLVGRAVLVCYKGMLHPGACVCKDVQQWLMGAPWRDLQGMGMREWGAAEALLLWAVGCRLWDPLHGTWPHGGDG